MPPRDELVDVVGHVGVSKSGKSYRMQLEAAKAISAGRRVAVFDRIGEWPGVCASGSAAVADGLEALPGALQSRHGLIIVRVKRGQKSRVHVARFVEACLTAKGCIVAINEAHHYFPVGQPLTFKEKRGGARVDSLDELVTAYRHYDCALWWDSQRLAKVDTTVREQTELYRMFCPGWAHDIEAAEAMGGRELSAALEDVSQRFEAGESDGTKSGRGYHVVCRRGQRSGFVVVR